MTSFDGRTWAAHRLQPPVGWTPVGWFRGAFWGVGGGALASSVDGLNWRLRFSLECGGPESCQASFEGLADNGTTLVAVGFTGGYHPTGSQPKPLIMTSNDGETWSERDVVQLMPNGGLSAALWDGSRFVVAGSGILTSQDGVDWTNRGGPGGSLLAWSGSEYLVAWGNVVARSSDLTVWESVEMPGSFLTALVWTGSSFVAATGSGEILESLDGLEWTSVPVPGGGSIQSLAAGQGEVVGVGSNIVWRESVGTWGSLVSTPVEDHLNAMTGWQGGVVAVGNAGAVAVSSDGRSWRSLQSPTDRSLRAVARVGWGLVAVGDDETILTSADGEAWVERHREPGVTLRDVAAVEGTVVAMGSGQAWEPVVLRSTDGASWEDVTLPIQIEVPRRVAGIGAGGGRFVLAVTYAGASGTGALLASQDGLTWTVTELENQHFDEVLWGNGRFLAVGSRPFVSEDGSQWIEGHWPEDRPVRAAGWTGSRFVVWTFDSRGWESSDGLDWRRDPELDTPAGFGVDSFAASGGYRIMGDGWALLRSQCGEAVDTWLPGTAHVTGANDTAWRTTVLLHNAGAETATVDIGIEPWGPPLERAVGVVRSVQPGAVLEIDDAPWMLFGHQGAATLHLRSWGGALEAQARTYNDGDEGTYGQHIPGLAEADAIEAGDTARLLMLASSPDPGSGFRSNLGLVNVGAAALDVDVELQAADGLLLGRFTQPLAAHESVQLDRVVAAFAPEVVRGGFAFVRTATPGGRFLAYLSVIDNRTGDPVFVLPAATVVPGEELWLPGAASATGQHGSAWGTDVDFSAPGPEDATVELEWFPWGAPDEAPDPVSLTVAGGTALRLEDVVGGLFASTGAGTLRLSPREGALTAAARTYNLGASGTFGQYIAARPSREVATFPAKLRVLGLVEDDATRSNLGLINASDGGLRVIVELYDLTGRRVGRLERRLEGFESVQLDRILSLAEVAGTARGYAVVWTTTLGGRLFAYASVIDNRSNDPVFVPGR